MAAVANWTPLTIIQPLASALSRRTNWATYDVVSLFPRLPSQLVQGLFGIACAFMGLGLRLIVDVLWVGAGPFALMVPFVLVATLFGRWQAGLVAAIVSLLHAWYYVLPLQGSFSFEIAEDGPRTAVNLMAALFVIALGEVFRKTMRQALVERDMLLREVEHRVKNNFASVASLLRLQMREHASSPTILTALQSALGRVESYAKVNTFLYRGANYTGTVNMSAYLNELCASLQDSALSEIPVQIRSEAASLHMEKERAIVVGLLVNEMVTNAIKHAFRNREKGEVLVRLDNLGNSWSLQVWDNGIGIASTQDDGSFGLKLISALAIQADAQLEIASDTQGTRYIVSSNG